MPKSSNYFGQSIYGQLIKSLDREKIDSNTNISAFEPYIFAILKV